MILKAMKKTALVLLLLSLLVLCSCGAKDRGICGKWETSASFDGENIVISYEFFEDGTGRYSMEGFTADRFTYETGDADGEILITVGSSTESVKYNLGKDALELVLDGQNVIFYRVDSDN